MRVPIPLLNLAASILSPVLDGKAMLCSFVPTPEVRIGFAFESDGSQSLHATEVPGEPHNFYYYASLLYDLVYVKLFKGAKQLKNISVGEVIQSDF